MYAIRSYYELSLGFAEEELIRRQICYGQTKEDIKYVLTPMVLDAKEAVGSMGDDTPLAVLSEEYRGLHHFFRQNFSQVTNPPIDSLRETSVMSLKTRLGNMGNILDENEKQLAIFEMASPVIFNNEFEAFSSHFVCRIYEVDCTFDVSKGNDEVYRRIEAIKEEVETAVT